MTFSRFEAIGTYLPSRVVTTEELIGQLANPPSFDYKAVTGVHERRFRAEDEDSITLALKAVDDCLARSQYEGADLDVVISTSITRTRGDRMYFEPSFASTVAKRIGAHNAIHFDLSNACAGMLTGTYVLDAMIRSGAVRRGLVVSGESITPIAETAVREISDKYDLQFASLSVGDSASAVVVDESTDESDRIHYLDMVTAAEYADACLGMPSEKTAGYALYTDNRRMHNENRFKLWTDAQKEHLATQGAAFADEGFDYVIHHQFGASAIVYMNQLGEREFDAPMPPSPSVIEKYGNTSTTSHFVVLHDGLEQKTIPKGSKILMVPAASGIVTGYLSTTITSLEA